MKESAHFTTFNPDMVKVGITVSTSGEKTEKGDSGRRHDPLKVTELVGGQAGIPPMLI